MMSVGVVEQVLRCTEPEDILARVGKRPVYPAAEVRRMCEGSEVLVLLFWHVADVAHPPSFHQMRKLGVVKGNIQSIQELPPHSDAVLKEVTGLDKRATLD